jgi:hypothetical protein
MVVVMPTAKGLAAVHLFAFLANKKGVLLLTLPRLLQVIKCECEKIQ